MSVEKNKHTAGADERTPSHPEYFSWVNNTNEGSTEAQTLANLEYFAYLRRTYNMLIEIYAWDAGNLDGTVETYQTMDSPKIRAQYPNGYGPIAEAAAKIGCRLGVWCSPDGFRDTPESAKARHEQMVALCRDFNFAQFKFDGVCGPLYPEHYENFVKMMKECRKYSPDLVALNHRLFLGEEGMKHVTTFLWEGNFKDSDETYVDVHMANVTTAPHHRAYIASRGNTPGLARLAEDHGVCISSCIDYFEDDLIIQAFGRCLIIAPEIYGNPWLMRDDEHAHLARIYNLHRRYRDILVNGMLLPGGDNYPPNAVARGSATKRFIAAGNSTWEDGVIHMHLDMEIGLAPCEKVSVILHHPFERFIGEFNYGDTVEVPTEPFRAVLIEVCDSREADVMLRGCEYEVLHEDENGKIDRVKIVSSDGSISYTDGTPFGTDVPEFDNTLRAPKKLGELDGDVFASLPEDSARQLEVAYFAQDHDSLEARSLKRSGETKIPEVQASRDAFFGQRTYQLRGCESRFAFDGNDETFFDGISKTFFDAKIRLEGGCLRVDFGAEYDADFVTVEYFDLDEEFNYYYNKPKFITWYYPPFTKEKQVIPPKCDFSTDLLSWKDSHLERIDDLRHETADILIHNENCICQADGRRRVVTYPIGGKVRYFRMPCPLDHIYKIALVKDGREIELESPRANNLLPYKKEVVYAKEMKVTVSPEDHRDGCYLAVGLEGEHDAEGAYAIIEIDGEYIGAWDRAPGYSTNPWECYAHLSNERTHHFTYYFNITPEMCGKEITVRVLGVDGENRDYPLSVHLCDKNIELDGIVADIK